MSTPFAITSLVESDATYPDEVCDRGAADGYLLLRGLIERGAVLALRRRVLEACARLGWLDDEAPLLDGVPREGVRLGAYDEPWVGLQREVLPLPEFAAVGDHPGLLSVLEALYGEPPLTRRGDVCRVMSPDVVELTTRPHQDNHFVRGSDAIWTAWVPLGDCPVALGGLAVLPGSHREGPRRHGESDEAEVAEGAVWATTDYAAGDALLFHCMTLHRACPNETPGQLRVSADFRYQPASHPFP